VGGDGLGFAGALQQEELREDGDGFEPDAEGPEDFGGGVGVGVGEGEDHGAAEEVLDAEGVEVGVVGGFVGGGHEVDGVAGGCEEEQFEGGVVEGIGEGPEEVEVTGYVDEEVKGLGFEGDAGAGVGLMHFMEED